jgi:hypothetical protein
MCYVPHEFCHFFRCYFRNMSDLDPLGEFVDGYLYEPVVTWGSSKRSHGVGAPHSEGTRWRNCAQSLSW